MSDTNLQLIFSEVHSIKTQIKELTNEVHERNNLQLYTKQEDPQDLHTYTNQLHEPGKDLTNLP